MSQLGTLIWLKWTLFRNALRSRKAVVGRAASTLGTLAALIISLLIASILGVATYFITSPNSSTNLSGNAELAGFLFLLMVFALLFLMWGMVPLGIGGGGSQFDPGRLLLYPISLRRLFAIDLLSELTSLASIFAVPVVLAIALAAGLANRKVAQGMVAGVCALAFGVAFTKLLSTSVGALMRKKRTRGETVLALIGAAAGLSGAFLGQLAPVFARHAETLRGIWWTPPGAVAVALTTGLRAGGVNDYLLALMVLAAYTALFVAMTYWVARRAALGMGGAKRAKATAQPGAKAGDADGIYAGWSIPFLSTAMSAVIEKEMRYAMRNAQLRMLALMPLILIGVRFMQGGGLQRSTAMGDVPREASALRTAFAMYGEGLVAALGVLYVFMILLSVACNLFAFEEGGMRAFILSPLNRRTILMGKNLTITFIALVFATLLMVINHIVFRDLTLPAVIFAMLCFVLFAAGFALIGNWLSTRFPKRLQFGKRLNASGVTGLLVIPIVIAMTLPPLLSVVAGYLAQSLAVKYATLALFAAVAVALYGLLISGQGRALGRREHDILEAVSGKTDN